MEVGTNEPRGLWLSDAHELCDGDGTSGRDLRRELPDGTVAEGRVVDIKAKVAVFDPKKLHSYVKGEDEENWIIAGFTPLGVETMPPHPTAILSRHGFPLDGTDVEVNDILDDELSVNDSHQGSSTEGGTSDEENVEEKVSPGEAKDIEVEELLRIAVALAVKMRWCIASTDVSNAFTLAPLPKDLMYALTPPTIVVLAGAASPGETWQITRVLYGLREAPRLWGGFRDDRLASARIPYEDKIIVLTATTTDENLWKVTFEGNPEVQGLVLAYVDDFLMLSARGIVKTIYEWLITDWKCTSLEWVEDGSLRFLGMELRVRGEGIHLSQAGYVRDLLRQHGISEDLGGGLTVPCNREWLQDVDSDEEVEAPEEATIKLAQKEKDDPMMVVYSDASYAELYEGCAAVQLGVKEDLPLETSMEFYFVAGISVVAAVGLWEFVKKLIKCDRFFDG
ncbi:hypothetical protein AK812_SmicGene40985 [Symbiodinium microadriaticum]|uniref:Reverse transcriptase Ty1/copia-type domain-containing protein n=1 Tax=Symbiodinium microadriaticum TaxID=2951 RepID=A0A1Q9C7B5_SYMMI|nr:hypothetical protein AK812_SmicGene40985 [Symbiodinium microadriaticum]